MNAFSTNIDGLMSPETMKQENPGMTDQSWLLDDSFKNSCAIASLYLLVICYGFHYVQKRGPLNLRRVIFAYDISMVLLNAYIVKEVFIVEVKNKVIFACQQIEYSSHPEGNRLMWAMWLFHISKVIECLDTVFFILSGNLRLVTWLHVYHHCTMIPYTCVLAKWMPSGQAFNLALTNGSVHVIMYLYYALAALGPAVRRYLWWKRYLTIFQMVQFVYGSSICMGYIWFGCANPPMLYYFSVAYIISILACFYNHYYQSYHGKKSHVQKITDAGAKKLE